MIEKVTIRATLVYDSVDEYNRTHHVEYTKEFTPRGLSAVIEAMDDNEHDGE